jgi:hypothetical protein
MIMTAVRHCHMYAADLGDSPLVTHRTGDQQRIRTRIGADVCRRLLCMSMPSTRHDHCSGLQILQTDV